VGLTAGEEVTPLTCTTLAKIVRPATVPGDNQGKRMSRFIVRLLVCAVVLGSLAGCVSTNASRLGAPSANRAVLLPESVALYRTAAQVQGRYEEIALLNSAGDSAFTNESKMFESMKKKAGELGANGIILDAISEPSAGAKVAGAIFGVSAQRKGKAVAIYVFPGTAEPVAEAPAEAKAE